MFEGTKTKNINKDVQEAIERGDHYLMIGVASAARSGMGMDETGLAVVNNLAEDGWRIVASSGIYVILERQ